MPFQHKSFWMSRDGACLTNGEMGYENSPRMEQKRGHQWCMDTAAPELFSNKKQAIESVNSRPVSGLADNLSPWHSASNFQSVSGQFTDCLFGSEPMLSVNMVDRNISPLDSENMNMGRKDFDDQYGNGASAGLSMSHNIDASSYLSFGRIRKVKVNEVTDSNNGMPPTLEQQYSGGVNSTVPLSTLYDKSVDNAISMDPAYGNGDENTISLGPTFTKADTNFITMDHTFNKRDGNFGSVGNSYKGSESVLSVTQPFDKEDGNFISTGQSYDKADVSLMSLNSPYDMNPAYGKANENLISMAPTFDKEGDTIIPLCPPYHKPDWNITAMAPTQDRVESSFLSMDQIYNKGESTTISFGGFNEDSEINPSGSIIAGYDLLMNNQNLAQASEVHSQKEFVETNPDSNVNTASRNHSKTYANPKHKEPKTAKKVSPNNFPSNVKSLLSTGMLDGVAVKYVSWSREKNLKGYIQGIGYMCGCKDCNYEKALNAYGFEQHANCKTKHPNNHIYFGNGKTIYAVVQELKNTPRELLFDAIQTVTGSQINQKNFQIWKASYRAATRELRRIYGTDDIVVSS